MLTNGMRMKGLGAIVLITAVVLSALGVINAKHQNRKAFVELQELKQQRDDIEVHWGRLQLEQGAWSTHGRVEQLARTRLGMTMPFNSSVVVVQP